MSTNFVLPLHIGDVSISIVSCCLRFPVLLIGVKCARCRFHYTIEVWMNQYGYIQTDPVTFFDQEI